MCGLFGIVSKTPKQFDYTSFCTLGIANDSRGGDSCGIFIDGHYEYGATKDDKWFQCKFLKSDYLLSLKETCIAFGHCRKASVGVINESTAQPVIITKEDKVQYVFMHNGTISNYSELAEKYIPDIDTKGLTDSQILAWICYTKGYDVLKEYVGTAAIAIADYRENKPKVLLFKGKSKKDSYAKELSEERPLCYCIDNETLLFSSIASYLMALKPKVITYTLTCNILYEFDGSELKEVKKIDRSNSYQKEKITYFQYDYSEYLYNYLTICQSSNTYQNKGKNIYGQCFINKWGTIASKYDKDTKMVYFWNGVALKSIKCYSFLNILLTRTHLTLETFNQVFNTLIRYLSIDGIFLKNDIWYKAISPKEAVRFSGTLNMLTSSMVSRFKDGFKVETVYSSNTPSFSKYGEDKLELTFKEIKEQCKYLMKQHKLGKVSLLAVK